MSDDADGNELAPPQGVPGQDEVGEPEEQFPWQLRESVDLDLHGAPTWDPTQYEPLEDDELSPARTGLFRRARPRPRPRPAPGPAHGRRAGADLTDASELTARLEREQRAELERLEAERAEAEHRQQARREAARADAERRREAERVEAERREAERVEAERREAERREAERVEAERREAERVEAERVEAERVEAERREAERVEAERREAERVEAEQVEAERREAERVEAERREAERVEAERVEAARREAERVEAERVEAERVEAARREAERVEAERVEAARREAERVEAERAEAARAAIAAMAVERPAATRSAVPTDEEVPIDLLDGDAVPTRPGEPPTVQTTAHPSKAVASPEAVTEAAPEQAAPEQAAPEPAAPEPVMSAPVVSAPAERPEPAASPGSGTGAAARPSPFANPMPVVDTAGPEGSGATPPHAGRAATEPVDDASAESSQEPAPKPGFLGRHRRGLIRTGVTVLIAATVAVLLRIFVVQPYYIPSASMEPTLHGCSGCTDDRVIVNKLAYKIHDVHTGDIVVFNRPANLVGVSDKVLIKRVIALGGDTLTLKNDQVYVNGLPIVESYLNSSYLAAHCPGAVARPETSTTSWRIPIDDVFVMGDNRCNSEDSRTFGPIAKSSIIGKADFIIWPLDRIGGL